MDLAIKNNLFTAQKGKIIEVEHQGLALGLLLKVGALALSVLTITGCSSLNIGESEFSCPGMPDGVRCMSTRDVYSATNDGNIPAPMVKSDSSIDDQKQYGATNSSDNYQVQPGSNIDPVRDPINAYVAPKLPNQPVPIRTPSQVMRVWVAPWEDTNGDLNVSGYLYTEIEPRRWVLGDPAPSSNPVLSPLTVVKQTQTDLNNTSTASPLQVEPASENLNDETQPNTEK